MARYKEYSYDQGKLIPIYFKEQILPSAFEYALNHIIDHELDLSIFVPRYKNDDTGAPAYDPAILLKIILYAYSRGITSSRRIEERCRTNVIFMALSADTQPHFTTLADFISTMDKEIRALFRNVLLICDEMGLIGKEMFAIDGCKLPSNASKEWSGTKEDFIKKKEKIEKTIDYILKKHQSKTGCLFHRQDGAPQRKLYPEDDPQDRLRQRETDLQPTDGDCRAGLCEPAEHPGVGPLHASREDQGQHPVVAFLYHP